MHGVTMQFKNVLNLNPDLFLNIEFLKENTQILRCIRNVFAHEMWHPENGGNIFLQNFAWTPAALKSAVT